MDVAIYARVSTDKGEQDPQVQVHALRAWLEASGHRVTRTFIDRISGAKASRPALDELTEAAGTGTADFEAVAIVKLDRLFRSVQHLIEYSAMLDAAGIDLIVKDQQVDTSTPAGRMMFHILGAVAEFERDLIRERTRAGLAYAAANGTRTGRPIGRPQARVNLERAERLVEELGSVSAAARRMRIPRETLRNAMRRAS